MYLTNEVKKEIFAKFGKNEKDTGSPEAQVCPFTHRIKHLTEHVKQNQGDRVTKRALITLVGKRKNARISQTTRYRTLQSFDQRVRLEKINLNLYKVSKGNFQQNCPFHYANRRYYVSKIIAGTLFP